MRITLLFRKPLTRGLRTNPVITQTKTRTALLKNPPGFCLNQD